MCARLGLFVILLAAYAATLGLHATPGQRYTSAEGHRLLSTASIVDDRDLNLRNQYTARAWRAWDGQPLTPTARVTAGRLVEAQGIGYPLLMAPAYAIGGATAVELQNAVLLALAFTLAVALARRLVPEPWATRGTLAVGLSPPALVASTTVAPVAAGALVLTGAALLALDLRAHPRVRGALACGTLLATTAWLDVHLALPGAVIGLAVWRWLRRRHQALAAFVALEAVLTSAVLYLTINERLYGGLTPATPRLAGGPPAGAQDVGDQLGRLLRLPGALLDQDAGALRWAPVLALAAVTLWSLTRSRRERLSAAITDQGDGEIGAATLTAIVAAAVISAAFARPSLSTGTLVPADLAAVLPLLAALVAFALRRSPRAAGLLVAVTLTGSVWLMAGARLDAGAGVAPPRGPLPWGGVERVLPGPD